MQDFLIGLVGEDYATPVMWTLLLLALAVLLWVVLRVVRQFSSGTFVSGGRGRKPRLSVIDATPVDNHRRLVLVRRDDVEHLVLIGGPNDVIVERDIAAPTQADAPAEPAPPPAPQPAAPMRQRPTQPTPPEPVQIARHQAHPPLSDGPSEPVPAHPATPLKPETAGKDEPIIQRRSAETSGSLLDDIKPSRNSDPAPAPHSAPLPRRSDETLEDEMSKLLEELSENKK